MKPASYDARACCDCGQMLPGSHFVFQVKRCDDCFRAVRRVYGRKLRARRKTGELARNPRPLWTEEEIARLEEACRRGYDGNQAAAFVGTRSAEACRHRAISHYLTLGRRERTYHGAQKYTPEQIKVFREAWAQYGVRPAARYLGVTPGVMSSIVHRYILHSPPSRK